MKTNSPESDLVEAALESYGIELKHVVSLHRDDREWVTGKKTVTITTKGGVTVKFSPGDEVKKLTGEQLNGDTTQRW